MKQRVIWIDILPGGFRFRILVGIGSRFCLPASVARKTTKTDAKGIRRIGDALEKKTVPK